MRVTVRDGRSVRRVAAAVWRSRALTINGQRGSDVTIMQEWGRKFDRAMFNDLESRHDSVREVAQRVLGSITEGAPGAFVRDGILPSGRYDVMFLHAGLKQALSVYEFGEQAASILGRYMSLRLRRRQVGEAHTWETLTD